MEDLCDVQLLVSVVLVVERCVEVTHQSVDQVPHVLE